MIAPPWLPIPPPAYGGTESVIDCLARGLRRAGHDVVLFTVGTSTVDVTRRWVLDESPTAIGDLLSEVHHVGSSYDLLQVCDVIHDHTAAGLLVAPTQPVPVVATCHGPVSGTLGQVYRRAARCGVHMVAISDAQRQSAPTMRWADTVHNGIDLAAYPPGDGGGGHLLFLGRMSADKGPDRAIRIARSAGLPLVIAAKMREPEEIEFFEAHVRPELGPGVEYVGEVGGVEKQQLLGGALALVNPIQWPEPFGLVMVEALASGTPVVAFPSGAAPEIVHHGVNGFLAETEEELAAVLPWVETLDRADCRQSAERFSMERMCTRYASLFHSVSGRSAPGPAVPVVGP